VASVQTSRLDSWKDIAAYLRRDVSTVIRWEKEKGLPVHRLAGGKRSAVFALTDEIDAWLVSQPSKSPDIRDEPLVSSPESSATPANVAPLTGFWVRHRMTITLLLIGLPLVIAAVVFQKGPSSGPVSSSRKAAVASTLHAGVFSFRPEVVKLPLAYTAALGDFNRDGIPDVAITGFNRDCVYVLLGKGDGTFAKPLVYPVGVGPDGIAVGDFDGDGRLDLAVANRGSNDISVLPGNGDGTFRSRIDLPTPKDPRGVAVGDFNGDGRADVAVTSYAANSLTVFTGSTAGLKKAETIPVGVNPYQVAVGDFNADGKLDLAVGNTVELKDNDSPPPPFTLSILLGDGHGGFRESSRLALGRGSTGIAVADFNHDGRPDLALTGFSEQACLIVLGNGDGTFQEPLKFPAQFGPLAVATGDLDGDGKLDMVVANSHSGTVTLLRGNGDGTFAKEPSLPAAGYPKSVVVADFNRDGKPDVLVTDPLTNSFTVFLNVTPSGG
jgi:FG-GAP-like repeat/FG-GAP repeat